MCSSIAIVVAPEDDIHAFSVRKAAISLGKEVIIIDSESFLMENYVSCSIPSRRSGKSLILHGAHENKPVSGLWWRRPRAARSSRKIKVHPGLEGSLEREATHALFGSLCAGISNAFNNIGASREASRKPLQLHHACKLGFKVPATLITNNPDEAINFFHALGGNVVYKLLNGTDLGFFETRVLREPDIVELWRASICPVMLQERIFGSYDLRVTVVGDELFCAKIVYDQDSEIVDSRFTTKEIYKHHLPESVSLKILEIMRVFGLTYGAIDLRVSKDEEVIFFELNPEGQYLWTEIEAGLPISEAICNKLFDI